MFGKAVRERRQRLRLTQENLAQIAGIDVKTIRSIETGRSSPRPSTMRLLAAALGLDAGDAQPSASTRSAHAFQIPHAQPPAIPAQLPLDSPVFAGRATHLNVLDEMADGAVRQPTAVVICAVWGTAGVGKTALAIRWAHRVRDRFPDGQLYVNLRGFDPSGMMLKPVDVIPRFLDALGVAPQQGPDELDAQVALYRSLLADRRMLIVLDNAYDADQIRPLLPGAPGCLVVITSRNQLASLVAREGAHPLPLDLLSRDEARDLLSRRLGTEGISREPDAVDKITERCVGLPLALALVAARAVTRPRLPLAALAAELDDVGDRLDALSAGDAVTDIRAVLSWSYQALSPEAAALFRLLGLHPGPDLSIAAAASLAGQPPATVQPLLGELAHAHLINVELPGRYTFHDLLRAYAAEQAESHDTYQQRHAAMHRMLDHYVHAASAAAVLLNPARDPHPPAEAWPGVTLNTLADREQALCWFDAEASVLRAVVGQAVARGFDRHVWQLVWSLDPWLERGGRWREQAAGWLTGLHAATRLADPMGQAITHRGHAVAAARLGHYDDAHHHLRRALDRYAEASDPVGQAHVHRNLAYILWRQNDSRLAASHAEKALALYRANGHHQGHANALSDLGWYRSVLGEHDRTLDCCEQALALFQQLRDPHGEANTWDSLGHANHGLGHHEQALGCYQRALALFRNLGDRYNEATTLTNLGDASYSLGRRAAAHDAWQQALAILDDLGHPDATQVKAKLHDLNAVGT